MKGNYMAAAKVCRMVASLAVWMVELMEKYVAFWMAYLRVIQRDAFGGAELAAELVFLMVYKRVLMKVGCWGDSEVFLSVVKLGERKGRVLVDVKDLILVVLLDRRKAYGRVAL